MRLLAFLFVICLLASCEVEEGKGGRATIQGKVFVDDFNQEGNLIVSDYAPDWDVYITYGDEDVVSDATVTHFDGSYEFDFLYEGNYTVYAYSKCNECANNVEAIIQEVVITEPDEVVVLPDLMVID